jgi:Peptidase propeptide and YPEB domain.
MKTSFYRLLAVALVSIFAATGAVSAGSRENERLQEGKITKNEAQHLVLKQFPGATIKDCELKTVKGHSVWVVSLMKTGDKTVAKVQVDGLTGKITL